MKPFLLERYFAKHEFNAKYLLSSSDCDGFTLDYVLSSANKWELELWNNLALGYTESLGHPLLREAITRHYNTVNKDEVFVLSPGEANYILMRSCLKPGDEVVCMRPAYQSLYQIAKTLGCNLSFWEPDESGSFNVDDLSRLVTTKTAMIILNLPHNPTGYYPTKPELDRIIEVAAKHNTFLFSDEMYHKLVHNPAHLHDSLVDLYENAVSLWGMAKSFGLAGLRIGWVVTHNQEVLKKMHVMKDYLTICSSAPSEILAIIALNNSENFIEVNLQKIRANKKLFLDFVKTQKSLIPEYKEPIAGSTAFVRLNLPESTLSYADNLVEKSSILLIPAEMFDYGHSHVRIGFGRESMSQALKLWEQVLQGNN